jgi:hypothetical protein
MRKVVFAINITADGYCGHTDMIADEELHDFFTRLLLRELVSIFTFLVRKVSVSPTTFRVQWKWLCSLQIGNNVSTTSAGKLSQPSCSSIGFLVSTRHNQRVMDMLT